MLYMYNTISGFRACFARELSAARKVRLKSRARENKFDVIIAEALRRLETTLYRNYTNRIYRFFSPAFTVSLQNQAINLNSYCIYF